MVTHVNQQTSSLLQLFSGDVVYKTAISDVEKEHSGGAYAHAGRRFGVEGLGSGLLSETERDGTSGEPNTSNEV
ncbi:hypothetical protein ColTof4_11503 [Colletotrichum tofieldiae]|nr:hypothetical protein ColTof3_04692 [Colletotrichum tofieldiae]GKT79080.1 hypothetical protein ColTof4_11503 [Colletotrichum tofieldiae]GKT86696.1 hypothetical protein Ct61P_04546 [Colletotrichum tofieldiae]